MWYDDRNTELSNVTNKAVTKRVMHLNLKEYLIIDEIDIQADLYHSLMLLAISY